MAMTLTIGGKAYDFKFGIRFVHKMNASQQIEESGMKFAIGLQASLYKWLGMDDPDELLKMLLTANEAAHGEKLTQEALEDYLDDLDENGFDALVNQLTEELNHSNFTKKAMAEAQSRVAKAGAQTKQTTKKG